MDWQALRIFLQTARHGSLRAAAAELGLSLPTLSRQLTAFEDGLGVRLLARTPRGVALTAEGASLLKAAAPLQERMADVERFAARLAAPSAAAVMRISATEPIISEILAPHIGALLAVFAGAPVELRVENKVVSLALNDADIAIRLARPDGDSLIARRVAILRMGIYGNSQRAAVIAREPASLADQPWLAYDDSYGPIPELRWIESQGLQRRVMLRTSSTRALVNAAAAGEGLAVLPALLADRDERLAEVSGEDIAAVPDRPIWAVWHRDRNREKRLRATIGWIGDAFRAAQRP